MQACMLLSTDHELIAAKNVSLAAMQGSASWSRLMFVTIQSENTEPSKEEMNKAVWMNKLSDVCS
jgi:hypothetical protein